MRLFIGIGLPAQIGGRLANAAQRLLSPARGGGASRIRWTPPANLHVTLSFLGQVEPSRLDQIQQSLATIHAAPIHLELSGVFATGEILLAKVKPAKALLALAEQVFVAMDVCGFPREQRPYTPHVTLARAKERIPSRLDGKGDPAFRQAFDANEFRLYESFTRPAGAQYEVRQTLPLR